MKEHYTLAYRLQNRKLTGIAGITMPERSCLRGAEVELQKAGFHTAGAYAVYFTTQLLKQKNFVGNAPLYKEL
jgi:hypothetical protein